MDKRLKYIAVVFVADHQAAKVAEPTDRPFDLPAPFVPPQFAPVLGGFLAAWLFGVQDAVNGINFVSLMTALVGAILLIAALRALPGRAPV